MWSPLLSCEPVDETRRAATLRQLAQLDQNDVIVEEACGVGWKQILVDHFGIDDQPATRNGDAWVQHNAGWPLLGFSGTQTRTYDANSSQTRVQTSTLLALPRSFSAGIFEMHDWKIISLEPLAPFGPLWPGFAINTIFYAAMLWLLWIAPGKIRRFIIVRGRIRRHRCPACGYQIAPGGGIGPVCSECGAALPAAWSTNAS
jgi:hypothetical protein